MLASRPGATGRCRMAQRPSIFRGKRAAFLSSGGMMTPRMSKVLKSFVVASFTWGPCRE